MGNPLSHRTILTQLRRNILEDYIARGEREHALPSDLLRFLALEPVDVPVESLGRISRLPTGLAHVDNPRPRFEGFGLAAFKSFGRQTIRFVIVAVLARYLPRVMQSQSDSTLLILSQIRDRSEGDKR